MKFLIYLLSLLIISLSCINCEDVVAMVNYSNEFSISSVEKSNCATEQDNCSPLCTCNCCGQPLVENVAIELPQSARKLVVQADLSDYHTKFISSYIKSIWQPPKLDNSFYRITG